MGTEDPTGAPWTADTLLDKLREHQQVGGSHGTNCTCMDGFIREYRKLLGVTTYAPPDGNWDNFSSTEWYGSAERAVQERLRYILHTVADTRSLGWPRYSVWVNTVQLRANPGPRLL